MVILVREAEGVGHVERRWFTARSRLARSSTIVEIRMQVTRFGLTEERCGEPLSISLPSYFQKYYGNAGSMSNRP